jgi:Flagellar motor switch protein
LLSPALASALMPARKQLSLPEHIERRGAAAAAQRIAIEAVLGSAEVSLQELTSLTVGDVIVLSEKLGAPSQVVIRGGEPVAKAALGCVDGRRAIQVESPAKHVRS